VTLVSPPAAGVWSLGCQCRRAAANAVSATLGPSQVGAAAGRAAASPSAAAAAAAARWGGRRTPEIKDKFKSSSYSIAARGHGT
jgi:hypothetical protein